MPTVVTEQGVVHYETLGRGRPVLLLHGWLGSWALYRQTIEVLSKDFKTYALDFFGFGESFDHNLNFSFDNFVDSVQQFMDRMGIVKAPLIGHSMGGTVSLAAAMRYPDSVVKVTVIGSPIQGKSLNLLLKLSGYRGTASIFWSSPTLLRLFIRGYAHYISRHGKVLGKMMVSDLSTITTESFFQSIGTLRDTDLTNEVGSIQVPIQGMYGKYDRIVNPNQAQVLKQYAPNSQIDWYDASGHFPMIDEPEKFHASLHNFLMNG